MILPPTPGSPRFRQTSVSASGSGSGSVVAVSVFVVVSVVSVGSELAEVLGAAVVEPDPFGGSDVEHAAAMSENVTAKAAKGTLRRGRRRDVIEARIERKEGNYMSTLPVDIRGDRHVRRPPADSPVAVGETR